MKRFLNINSLLVLLLLGLISHNFYLQGQVQESLEAAQAAAAEASRAARNADTASSYASEAAEYSRDAADEASKAADSADDAYWNSFGNQCTTCPGW